MLSALLILPSLLLGVIASPLVPRDDAPDCAHFPAPPFWFIEHFESNTTDSVGSNGTLKFELINGLSQAITFVSCSLQVNYRCVVSGISSDPDLVIDLAVRASWLTITLDRTLHCSSWDQDVGGTVVCKQANDFDRLDAQLVELAPDSSGSP
ncbi:hypothetical protein QBC47DRAFT_434700 [Echria macrotheca]|uniref:AA1-like domain-containing protein n=1 Tax=Echria macrotheca TaxID=438768 RepID=A0AAJ0B7B8_9PEZI|nr:hypothetical protein QBC47DRAFT_434700 [Echria macrotheca]